MYTLFLSIKICVLFCGVWPVIYEFRIFKNGDLPKAHIPLDKFDISPSTKNINLRQSPGVKINEFEVLLRGRVSGASTTRINE